MALKKTSKVNRIQNAIMVLREARCNRASPEQIESAASDLESLLSENSADLEIWVSFNRNGSICSTSEKLPSGCSDVWGNSWVKMVRSSEAEVSPQLGDKNVGDAVTGEMAG